MIQTLEGLDGVLNIADDILIYGVGDSTEEANADHDRKLEALLQRCRERGIALNRDKLKLRLKRATFMGHVLTDHGLEPDPDKIEAVLDIPTPQNVEDPKKLREVMKQKIHSSHMGTEACLRRARESIYWPGMCAEMK